MPYSLSERIGMSLQKIPALDWMVLKYHGTTPTGKRRYINRISGHLVVRPED